MTLCSYAALVAKNIAAGDDVDVIGAKMACTILTQQPQQPCAQKLSEMQPRNLCLGLSMLRMYKCIVIGNRWHCSWYKYGFSLGTCAPICLHLSFAFCLGLFYGPAFVCIKYSLKNLRHQIASSKKAVRGSHFAAPTACGTKKTAARCVQFLDPTMQ